MRSEPEQQQLPEELTEEVARWLAGTAVEVVLERRHDAKAEGGEGQAPPASEG
jgi:hypothetical protein